jgi:hypothetical protein
LFTTTLLDAAAPKAGFSGWKRDALLGAALALLALVLHAVDGFPTLTASHGDNDSLLRLVQIRDLIGGQGWFDLHQYRMGPEGGFVMHWSRLVDAPIAAIILAVQRLTGSMAAGETVALVAWPLALMALAMALMLRIARAVGGEWAVLPALAIGGAALYFVGIFAPGNIDHHNVQLVLTLATLAVLGLGRGFGAGLAAGAASALMLAVGMETLPYVAVAGLAAAVAFLAGGHAQAAKATGFGIGLAGLGAAAFFGTVLPSAWFAAQCDAYSIPQFAIALIAGAGLALACAFAPLRRTVLRRLVALAALGIATGATVVTAFPQCLADPYAGLDPQLRAYMLSAITEAQPVWTVVALNKAMALSYYVTPLLGLAAIGARLRTEWPKPVVPLVAAFLAAAVAVSLWEVRGAMFSIPLGAIPLAAWVGDHRRRVALAGGSTGQTLRMVLAWLVSLNVAWSAAANAAARALDAPVSPAAAPTAGTCDDAGDYAQLAGEPAATVLAVSNLGAPILFNTHHRVLAGPYHRNVAGNLLALKAFMGSPDDALAVVRQNHVGLVALCRGNDETAALSEWAPSGFIAALAKGAAPAWLERLPAPADAALEIYRVREAR